MKRYINPKLLQMLVLGAVKSMSRGFMNLLTATEIEGEATLEEAFRRPTAQGLLTVSNHTAALDDPLLLSVLMPQGSLLRPAAYRWGMCATDRCFKNDIMGAFFRAGKVEHPGVLTSRPCHLPKEGARR